MINTINPSGKAGQAPSAIGFVVWWENTPPRRPEPFARASREASRPRAIFLVLGEVAAVDGHLSQLLQAFLHDAQQIAQHRNAFHLAIEYAESASPARRRERVRQRRARRSSASPTAAIAAAHASDTAMVTSAAAGPVASRAAPAITPPIGTPSDIAAVG